MSVTRWRRIQARADHAMNMHAQSLHISGKNRLLHVVKQTPFCRDSATNGAVVSLDRTGRRVDTSTQERGGE
jgi:hypothetical protein